MRHSIQISIKHFITVVLSGLDNHGGLSWKQLLSYFHISCDISWTSSIGRCTITRIYTDLYLWPHFPTWL